MSLEVTLSNLNLPEEPEYSADHQISSTLHKTSRCSHLIGKFQQTSPKMGRIDGSGEFKVIAEWGGKEEGIDVQIGISGEARDSKETMLK